MSISRYFKKIRRQVSRTAKKHGKYLLTAGALFVPGAPAALFAGAKALGAGALGAVSFLTGPTTGLGLITSKIGSFFGSTQPGVTSQDPASGTLVDFDYPGKPAPAQTQVEGEAFAEATRRLAEEEEAARSRLAVEEAAARARLEQQALKPINPIIIIGVVVGLLGLGYLALRSK